MNFGFSLSPDLPFSPSSSGGAKFSQSFKTQKRF